MYFLGRKYPAFIKMKKIQFFCWIVTPFAALIGYQTDKHVCVCQVQMTKA